MKRGGDELENRKKFKQGEERKRGRGDGGARETGNVLSISGEEKDIKRLKDNEENMDK